MMKTENQRIKNTKQMIKESLLKLLNEKDLDHLTVTELCRKAGVNRATFYRHYEIPHDVMIEIEKDMFTEMRNKIQLPTSEPEVKERILEACHYLQDRKKLLHVIVKNNSETDFMYLVNQIYKEFWDDIKDMKLLHYLDQQNMKLIVLYTAGGCYFVLRQWLMGNVDMSAQQMAEFIYNLVRDISWSEIPKN